MSYSQLDAITHMDQQLVSIKLILAPVCGINKVLRFVGMGSNKLEEIRLSMKKINKSLQEFKTLPSKFNKIFADKGWISYDSLNFDLMREMVKLSEDDSIETAEQKMLDYLKPEKIERDIFRLFCIPKIQIRRTLIELAFEDYKAERYHAVIPILLMMIDGIVNDIVDKGFHSKQADLDVWDSLTNIDGGIYKIREIFSCGRKKTRVEEISLPFRNGILHGMDLGYNNYLVAAKCWNFLFVVKDWAVSKQTEEQRKEKFQEDTKVPTFRELADQLSDLDKSKKALAEWKPRVITKDDIKKTNNNETDPNTPEAVAVGFLDLWKRKNYGHMANDMWSIYSVDSKPDITGTKMKFQNWLLKSYVINEIHDEAPAISELFFTGIINSNDTMTFKVRMLYEQVDGHTLSRNMGGGEWKVIWIQEFNEDYINE